MPIIPTLSEPCLPAPPIPPRPDWPTHTLYASFVLSDWSPTPIFLRLTGAVFTYARSFPSPDLPTPSGVQNLTPRQLASLFSLAPSPPHGVKCPSYAAAAAAVTMFSLLDIDYMLVFTRHARDNFSIPACQGARSPTLPILTERGFQRLFYLEMLTDPDRIHALLSLLIDSRVLRDPVSCEDFPPGLPRSCAPLSPAAHVSDYFRRAVVEGEGCAGGGGAGGAAEAAAMAAVRNAVRGSIDMTNSFRDGYCGGLLGGSRGRLRRCVCGSCGYCKGRS